MGKRKIIKDSFVGYLIKNLVTVVKPVLLLLTNLGETQKVKRDMKYFALSNTLILTDIDNSK